MGWTVYLPIYMTRWWFQIFVHHVFETSRIVCGVTFINNFWLTGVSLYGLPVGPTHPQAKAKTNLLVEAAVRRLLLQDGPRYLAGDFNQDLSDVPAIQLLLSRNFIEVQDLFYHQTGTLPRPTCKGKTRRDYLFISRELIPMFRSLEIDSFTWPDHATLVAHFQGSAADLVRYPWPKPHQVDWRLSQDADPLPVLDFLQTSDCTKLYSQFWNEVESRHATAAKDKGSITPFRCFGRGQRLKPDTIRVNLAPVKKGRNGEFQPKFFGISLVHCHWVKQVRRLQSFVRLTAAPNPTLEHRDHTVSLWQSILRAPGFAPSFAIWWSNRNLAVGEPAQLPEYPPTVDIASLIFHAVQWETSILESSLQKKHGKKIVSKSGEGMAQVYATVRRDAPQPVEVLLQSIHSQVSAIDHDTCAIELDTPQCFDPHKPIRCGQHVLQPIVVTDDKIWVEHLPEVRPGELVIQEQFKGNLGEIFEAFTIQWKQRWGRHADLLLSHWEGILSFARQHLGAVAVAPPSFSVPQIRATVAHKKAKAAVGLDGVSRQDLLALGPNGMLSIESLLNRAHQDGQWPQQLLQGQITSLAKRSLPAGPEDFRPITVFSIIYRTWSTIISRYWIHHLTTIVDDHLFGNRASYRAAHLWRCILDEIESAHCTQSSVCGLVVDLEKAFNTLPRKITLAFAALAGLDQGSLRAWAGALGMMERRFAVMGSLSLPVSSSCGFAEGCGMSVVAMMLIDQVWHHWVRAQYQLCTPMSFVDNWEIVTTSPEAIEQVFRATLAFADQMDLTIDRRKTFVWATSPHHRGDLRSRNFQVQLDHPDLGAHITYSKQTRNASLVARFHSLSDFWEKLRLCGGSFACKVKVVASAAWPRAMHGISATWVSMKHIHNLRSRYMSSLRLDKPGANSYLQLHLDGFGMDPQAYAIMRDFRDLGSSEWHLALLDEITQCNTPGGSNTVTRVLKQRIELLGWTFTGHDVVSDDLGPFRLSRVNWTELCLRVQRSWHRYVHAQIAHRSDFAGFQHVGFGATRKIVSALSSFDQGVCRRNMNGSTLTNEHSCFWSSTSTGTHLCRFCNAPDSLNHRYWECSESSDLRSNLGASNLQVVALMPPVCTIRSWQLQSSHSDEWWSYLASLPQSCPDSAVELPTNRPLDLFTDGSAFWQDKPEYRLAAWSICLAQPPTIESSSWEASVVAAGPVAGLVQTSFRAELTAISFAVQYACRVQVPVRIWTDSQSVIDHANQLLQGTKRIKPNSANADLWCSLQQAAGELGCHNITLIKVAAHEDPQDTDSEFDRWCKFNNSCADAAARAANSDRSPKIWALWERHSSEVIGLRQLGHRLLRFQLDVCKRWSDNVETGRLVQHREPRFSREIEQFFRIQPVPEQLPQGIIRCLGEAYSQKLIRWWEAWIQPGGHVRWISFAQCFLHFMLWAKHPGAVRVQRKWVDPELEPLTLPESYSFRVRCKWFRLQLQQIWKCFGWEISTCCTRPESDFLPCHIGCGAFPVKQEAWSHVETWLGTKLSRPISGHGEALDVLPHPW